MIGFGTEHLWCSIRNFLKNLSHKSSELKSKWISPSALSVIYHALLSSPFWWLFMQISVIGKWQSLLKKNVCLLLTSRSQVEVGGSRKRELYNRRYRCSWNINVILEVTDVATFIWMALNLTGLQVHMWLGTWCQWPRIDTRFSHFPTLWHGVCYSYPHLYKSCCSKEIKV